MSRSVPRLDGWTALFVLALLEAVYIVLTRLLMPRWWSDPELELAITGPRLASIALCWLLFCDLIRSRTPRPAAVTRQALPMFALAVVVLIPLLFGNDARPGWRAQLIYGLTSFVVGLREEMVYRAVLQNLLERKLGWIGSALLSSVLFAFYHYGYGGIPFTGLRFIDLFTFGLIFGVLYRVSGSLGLVALLHGVLDLLWSYSPWIKYPLPHAAEAWVEGVVAAVLLAWSLRHGRLNRT